ncbi:MAG TPA: creatininase family protein [Methylovirgula sp.]|nr:creatininase family protein [Methylovirgula sp.]
MLPTRFWAEMSWKDFQSADMEEAIAVLPVAAVEQHGPHLPLGVDLFLMQGYVERVVARLPEGLPVLFLPIQTIGVSVEHSDFPGTLSLSATSLMNVLTEIGECVERAGCRKLVLLNSHGGNVPLIDMVAHDLRARLDMLVVLATWHRFGYPDGLFSEEEQAHGIHAGDVETSLMLTFRPDLVRRNALDNFVSKSAAIEANFTWLRTGRPTGFGWMAQDLNPSGAVGNAAAASAEKGEACADYGATAFIELLQDVEAFDLARLGSSPDQD